jgi:hypothetical protein
MNALQPRALMLTGLAAACIALAGCATPQERAVSSENLLSAAGFSVRPANTPERVASLHSLPPNKVVQRIRGGSVRYVYADPLVCACLYVGDQAAFSLYQQQILQRRLADEQAMTAQMNQMNWDEGPWGQIW